MAHSPFNDRLAELQRHRENRARLAFAYHRVVSEGYGTVEFEERVDFGLTFVERPFVSCGFQIEIDDRETAFPTATGYVTDWDTTDRDHYVGCWVAVVVAQPPDATVFPDVKIWHDFTFSAIALKDIPTEL